MSVLSRAEHEHKNMSCGGCGEDHLHRRPRKAGGPWVPGWYDELDVWWVIEHPTPQPELFVGTPAPTPGKDLQLEQPVVPVEVVQPATRVAQLEARVVVELQEERRLLLEKNAVLRAENTGLKEREAARALEGERLRKGMERLKAKQIDPFVVVDPGVLENVLVAVRAAYPMWSEKQVQLEADRRLQVLLGEAQNGSVTPELPDDVA